MIELLVSIKVLHTVGSHQTHWSALPYLGSVDHGVLVVATESVVGRQPLQDVAPYSVVGE